MFCDGHRGEPLRNTSFDFANDRCTGDLEQRLVWTVSWVWTESPRQRSVRRFDGLKLMARTFETASRFSSIDHGVTPLLPHPAFMI